MNLRSFLWAAAVFCTTAAAQITVTISQAPPASIAAAWGAPPAGMSLYRAVACTPASSPARAVAGGAIEQLAESHSINITPAPLDSATSASLQSRSLMSRLLTGTKYTLGAAAAAGASTAAFKASQPDVANSRAWSIGSAAAAAIAVGLQLGQVALESNQSAQQQQIAALANSFLNPSSIYPIPAGGCTPAILFFGGAFSSFAPITGTLP